MVEAAAGDDRVLVACSHGTADPAGRRTITAVLDGVRARRPGLQVLPAFVDVEAPRAAEVVADVVSSGRRAVVVPVLLSTGYHTKVDIAAAVEAGGDDAVAALPLGPDGRLTALLVTRLRQAGAGEDDGVVLAAAGSSDEQARGDVETVAAALQRGRRALVKVGYGASAPPSVPQAVASLRADGHRRVVVAAYLLAPGFFYDRLLGAGADAVTAPLAPDPAVVSCVLDRFDEAVRGRSGGVA